MSTLLNVFRISFFLASLANASELPKKSAWSLSSGPHQVQLLELYSSEGCSSCPPAERWLSAQRTSSGLWTKFVPIEFHVDYWNHLGWVDRFANAEFAHRQRRYSREWGLRQIYTPAFVLNGQRWSPSSNLTTQPVKKTGDLQVKAQGSGKFLVSFETSQPVKNLQVHAALLGNGLKTQVRAGENAGALLKHDFVVLALSSPKNPADHFHQGQFHKYQSSITLPRGITNAPSYSVAFWVTNLGSQKPLQAVGGDLPVSLLTQKMKLKN